MKIKGTMTNTQPSEWQKELENMDNSENMGHLKFSYTVDEYLNWYSHLRKLLGSIY